MVRSRTLRRQAERRYVASMCAAAMVTLVVRQRRRRRCLRGICYKRRRMQWDERCTQLLQGRRRQRQFIARYRMDEHSFQLLADELRDDIEGDPVKSDAAGGGVGRITAEIKLSATLRWLAGGAWQDIVDMHGIGESTLRSTIMEVWAAMRKHHPLQFDIDDDRMLLQLEQEFAEKSASGGFVRNCVGCIDGLAIRVNCPSKSECKNPAAHLNRKGFYSVNCQAMCDAQKRFRWFSMDAAGATHDQLAFECSKLGQRLLHGDLPEPFCPVSYTHLRAHETVLDLVCRLLLEKKQ
eukprot:TRINITY_DN14283_c0_g1_i2.p1 TRINITY_DN14283_c0_g1~~TRINITY_DN14283_c0_g1_i2.p1  ORF type:complete len:294 (-),score=48.53 TRINITY_DN14283_c0_g1_i2:6-887(-)